MDRDSLSSVLYRLLRIKPVMYKYKCVYTIGKKEMLLFNYLCMCSAKQSEEIAFLDGETALTTKDDLKDDKVNQVKTKDSIRTNPISVNFIIFHRSYSIDTSTTEVNIRKFQKLPSDLEPPGIPRQ